jgi:hypothetical protein
VSIANPTEEQALQFCIMLQAGLPAEHAILYFVESDDRGLIELTLSKWTRSRAVAKAQERLLGKKWQDMSLDEKCNLALDQQYASMAYLCYSTNYVTAGAAEKGKLDTARTALEARKAGTSGKVDPIWQFIEDFKQKEKRKALIS